MRGEILTGVERRRRWSVEEKLRVVRASLEPDAVVSDVARRFDVTRQQVYDWRRAARRGDFDGTTSIVGFIEVRPPEGETDPPPDAETPPEPSAPDVMIEIGLPGGRSLRVPAALATADLRRLIRAVEGA